MLSGVRVRAATSLVSSHRTGPALCWPVTTAPQGRRGWLPGTPAGRPVDRPPVAPRRTRPGHGARTASVPGFLASGGGRRAPPGQTGRRPSPAPCHHSSRCAAATCRRSSCVVMPSVFIVVPLCGCLSSARPKTITAHALPIGSSNTCCGQRGSCPSGPPGPLPGPREVRHPGRRPAVVRGRRKTGRVGSAAV